MSVLSVRQLVDIELGLYILSVVSPGALPLTLSDMLQPNYAERSQFTPQQYRYLRRGRLLIGHFAEKELWCDLLTAYVASPSHRLAFEVSPNLNSFSAKVAGFSRNRLSVLRKMLA